VGYMLLSLLGFGQAKQVTVCDVALKISTFLIVTNGVPSKFPGEVLCSTY
jgi:hypothetical protein